MYFKVVRRRKPSSAGGTKGWRARMGNHSPLSLGVSPDIFFILSVSMVVLMGFNAVWTRLQSLWIMFFFARKDFPCGVRNRMQDKILFRQLRFSPFSSARYFDRQSLYILNGFDMGSRCSYYVNSQRFKL